MLPSCMDWTLVIGIKTGKRHGSLCSGFLVTRESKFRPRTVWLHLAGLVGLCLELSVLFLKCSVLREGGGGGGLVQFDQQDASSLFRSGEFVTAEFHWSHNSLWNLIWSEVFHYMCLCVMVCSNEQIYKELGMLLELRGCQMCMGL